jgi:hypothetical protein
MKNLRTAALCASMIVCSLTTLAQKVKPPVNEPNYNKPRLFDHLPDRIPVTTSELDMLIDGEVGQSASVRFSGANAQQFDGEVVSTAIKYGNKLRSVVIRSTNFNGARFTLSKITSAEGKVSYTGRIISFQHGDLFELQEQAGELVLVKRNYYELINE